ncbi:sortase-dependent protein [Streptomyces sp. NPDC059785]|uniref:sortase-dependent protein n=1 Tax=unclassified Streptomyces TaxID=2593676 RepID=UPI00364CABD6
MRRTVPSAMALAATAVLAGAVPAFADGASASPVPSATTARTSPTPVPSSAPAERTEPTRAPAGDQVTVVPEGAADTGVATDAPESGNTGGLIGGGAAAVLLAGGATAFVVRRRRATGE